MSDLLHVYARYTAQQGAGTAALQPNSVLLGGPTFSAPLHDFVMDVSFAPAGSVVTYRHVLSASVPGISAIPIGPTRACLVYSDDPQFATYGGQILVSTTYGNNVAVSWGGGSGLKSFPVLAQLPADSSTTFAVSLMYAGGYTPPTQPFGVTVVTW